MPEPDHTPIGARLRERTQPLAPDDAANGYAHAHLCEGIGRMLAQVAEAFDPEDPDVPPFAPLLDVDLCPAWALGWLGQWVGVVLPPSADENTARTLIRSVAGFSRGTPAALEAAAGLFLTGTKTVYFRERDPDAYTLEVVTLTDETPDPEAVLAALLAQKPGGIVLNYSQVAGWDYQAMTDAGGTYTELAAAFATYFDLTNNDPI